MRYQQFLDIVLGRCRSLTFLDPETSQVDTAEVELAAYNALLDIADGWEFDTFMVINENIAKTVAGLARYPLPSDFGRLRVPKEEDDSGIYIQVDPGYSPTDLYYRDHDEWFDRRAVEQNSTPVYFSISGNDTLLLDPTPDDNRGRNYTIQGVYVRRITALDGDDPILVSHPTALINATLARLAVDKRAEQAAALVAERNVSLSKMVNNQARTRQNFRRWTDWGFNSRGGNRGRGGRTRR